jgi:hypothetical protein
MEKTLLKTAKKHKDVPQKRKNVDSQLFNKDELKKQTNPIQLTFE